MSTSESPNPGVQLTIVTPEATVLETRARFVALPLYDGEIGIGRGHSPMIGRLGFGELRIKSEDGAVDRYYIDGGFVQVADNTVSVLTNRSMPAGDLDADVAAERLSQAVNRKAAGDEEIAIRERLVDQARAQIRVARRAK